GEVELSNLQYIGSYESPAAGHLGAVKGKESEVRLKGEFANMFLRVMPLHDEAELEVLGCISILNTVRE
ncbi:MAG: hypothetical protein ABIV13_01935, partial [Fimbriimonadales bacterium]